MPRAPSTSPRCSSSQRPQRIGRASSPAARALPPGSRSMTCDHHGIELQTTCLGLSGAPAVPPFLLPGARIHGSPRADHRAAAAFHMLREKSSRNPAFAVPHVEAAKRIRVETSDAPLFPSPLPVSHVVILLRLEALLLEPRRMLEDARSPNASYPNYECRLSG